MVLTNSNILEGITKVEKYRIESLDDDLYLRPLSHAEVAQIDEIEAAAVGVFETNEKASTGKRQTKKGTMESKGKLNLLKMTRATNESKIEAILKSLDNKENIEDPFKKETINQLARNQINEIFEKVQEISGIGRDEDELEDFPEES